MFANLLSWISKAIRLALIARSTYDRIISDLEGARETIKMLDNLVGQLLGQKIEAKTEAKTASEALVVAVDRLALIAEKETASANATTRKMAKIAREAIAEIEELSK